MSKITLDEYLKKQRETEELSLPSGLVVRLGRDSLPFAY